MPGAPGRGDDQLTEVFAREAERTTAVARGIAGVDADCDPYGGGQRYRLRQGGARDLRYAVPSFTPTMLWA